MIILIIIFITYIAPFSIQYLTILANTDMQLLEVVYVLVFYHTSSSLSALKGFELISCYSKNDIELVFVIPK